TVTILESDQPADPVAVATLNAPVGIDYHSVSNVLIISYNNPTGTPKNFLRLFPNGTTDDWSSLGRVGDVATVKVTTNNWTAGDVYFGMGQPGVIGKISADGSTVITNWATLTNAAAGIGETNFVGSLYIDQSGVFNGDLIVVTSGSTNSPSDGGTVWRVTAAKNASRVAQVLNPDGSGQNVLEGVLTVPNNLAQYGPWAGKILTCGEKAHLIYAIDVNGNVSTYTWAWRCRRTCA